MLAMISRADMMALMPGNKSGAESRRMILAALLEAAPQTVSALARAADMGAPACLRMLRRMERDGLVTMIAGVGRRGSDISLTPAGRTMARDLETLPD